MNINRICLVLVIALLGVYIYAIVNGLITHSIIVISVASVGLLFSLVLFIRYKLWNLWITASVDSSKEEAE